MTKQKLLVIPGHHADRVQEIIDSYFEPSQWEREDKHYILEEGPYSIFAFVESASYTFEHMVRTINDQMRVEIESDDMWTWNA